MTEQSTPDETVPTDPTVPETPDGTEAPQAPQASGAAEAPAAGLRSNAVDSDYDASAIQVLEGLEAVRKRPGMYIGSTGERGLHHLIWEVVDNAVDESLAGHCDRIVLTLLADGGIRVEDNGRGIPTDTAPGQELPALTMALTLLHAGGKFGGGGYKVSGGLHGVGISVVNALSTRVIAEVKNRGHQWRQSFAIGVPEGPLEQVRPMEPGERTGTTITYYASPEIFETVTYNLETITSRIREMAFLNKGLEIVVRDERPQAEDVIDAVQDDTVDNEVDHAGHDAMKRAAGGGLEQVFKYDRGLVDYVEHLNRRKTVSNPSIISFEAETPENAPGDHMSLEVAMQWNTTFSESVHTFANTINTHEGGTHEEGFRKALTRAVNDFARSRSVLKDKDDNLQGEDVREGLTAVIAVRVRQPQFEGQTKTKLGNTEIRSFVEVALNRLLPEWLEKHAGDGRKIAEKCATAQRARLAARQARELTRRKSGLDSGGLPGKLWDCSSREADSTEIFIVEGDSAGGSAKQARNSEFQAILPIRGKIINVEKNRLTRVLQNNEIQALITAIGTGIGDEFELGRARYHKIVILTDADVDGAHIRTLLMTFFFRHMRHLIEAGYVYIAQPPLYQVSQGRKTEYAYTEREIDELRATFDGKRPKIQRYKGLGEMNADQLWETTMDPAKRVLLQVDLADAALAEEVFSTLMGDDVEARRTFIQRNAKDVRFLDI